MNIRHFRLAAGTLISFNILGTVVTWAAHLQKPAVGAANAIVGGTQFTGPLVLVVLGAAALALSLSGRRWVAGTGVFLLALYGAGFAVGEISELFQRNVGISAGRWDVVLAGSVIGAVIGIACAVLGTAWLVSQRRASAGLASRRVRA